MKINGNLDTTNIVNLSEALGFGKEETTTESQPETVEKPQEAEEESAPSQEGEEQPEVQEEPKTETPTETKEIPFNKHPRFKRIYKELQELRAWKEEMQKQPQEQPKAERTVEKPRMSPEFVRLFGENEEAWETWQAMRQAEKAEVLREAEERAKAVLESERAQARQQEEITERVVEMVEDRFLDLGESIGIDLSDPKSTERNQILDICDKYQLFDENGIPNIEKANELRAIIYPERSKEVVQEKRQVVAKTNVKTNSSAKESDMFTHQKLQEIKKRGGVHFFLNK